MDRPLGVTLKLNIPYIGEGWLGSEGEGQSRSYELWSGLGFPIWITWGHCWIPRQPPHTGGGLRNFPGGKPKQKSQKMPGPGTAPAGQGLPGCHVVPGTSHELNSWHLKPWGKPGTGHLAPRASGLFYDTGCSGTEPL